MKRVILILLLSASLFPAGAAWAADSVLIKSPHIEIRYDNGLARRILWNGAAGIVSFDPAAQEGIQANGWDVTEFRLDPASVSVKRVNDAEFGAAEEATFTATYSDEERNLQLRRRSRVLLPDRYPDAAIFQSFYENTGKARARVTRVYSQRLLLDRRLAEPDQASADFVSFQGGAYKWGRDYSMIPLKPGFRQKNFMGLDDRTGPEGEGGGMPIVDVWSPAMGVAMAHIEKQPAWVSLPVEVRADNRTELAVTEEPSARLKQKEWLAPGETYPTVMTAVIFHHGDYFDALATYADLLRARGLNISRTSPDYAYEPYWKSWGFEFNFTLDKIYSRLPELKAMGIHIANLDDGWFDWYGDWNPLRKPGKFPNGEADVKEFTAHMHREGFQTAVWWYPLGVSPESRLAREHADLLVQDENGQYTKDDRGVYQLCPAYEPARRHIANLIRRFVRDWGFDGVYVDSVGLTAVPACFNPAHHHGTPIESFQSIPKMFETIDATLHEVKKDPWLDVCICAMPHSPYNMPYYALSSASDPTSTLQVRERVKIDKALRGPGYAAGDCYQVPLQEWKGSSVPESFETAVGTGAVVQTFFVNLTEDQIRKWTRWVQTYRELQLSRADYQNLYDIAWDKPEGHAIRKGNEMYYGFYADVWPVSKAIQLRGLEQGKNYDVYDYAHQQALGTVSGDRPYIKVAFKDSLLLRVIPRQ